ncbi:MAG: methylenetetrahydrofolate reductase C-terminal domain-containing protein [Nanoarchaeota archaeon]|nr:methylenetetrahydrofolate reductase C-terminal domain-containing protein [Nanoarchaeota archaeon]
MIVTEKKKIEDILEKIRDCKKIVIFGCGDCATLCKTGGKDEVEELKKILEDNEKQVVYTSVIDISCDERIVKKELKNLPEYDCIISLSCGTGTQTVGDIIEKPVFSGLDSKYAGSTRRIGHFTEKCSLCGECIINDFGGICPITRCSKHLLNGPCGGSVDGKCEVGDKDCAWVLIYKRMKKQGREKELLQYRKPKNWK